jgi:menaquinone-dependent protoporphyrinogen oxidase
MHMRRGMGNDVKNPHVLVTWGSKMGGTEGVARMIAEALEREGVRVTLAPAAQAPPPDGFDAAIVGAGLYANRWQHDARHYVKRNTGALRKIPTWLFSSGPLDDSADRKAIPATRQVEKLGERIGAQGHVTFGGRLPSDAKGIIAHAMAKQHAGDWRNPQTIHDWARSVARALPEAKPRAVEERPGLFARLTGRLRRPATA